MRLNGRTRDIIDIICMTGLDLLANAGRPHSAMMRSNGWDDFDQGRRRLQNLRKRGLIDWQDEPERESWVPQVTYAGKELLAHLVDPETYWNAKWDGRWRLMTFDLGRGEYRSRKRLDTWLANRRFGRLQGSIWISPRPYSDWAKQIDGMEIDPRDALFFDGHPLGGLDSKEVVSKAWDFAKINELHEAYLRFHERTSHPSSSAGDVEETFASWYREESNLWRELMAIDPLLPSVLHPPAYKGRQSWDARKQAFVSWKTRLETSPS